MLVGRVSSFVLVFQLCLGVLGLLGFFGVVYYPTIHRATETVRFSLGFSLVVPLLVLMVAWVVCVLVLGVAGVCCSGSVFRGGFLDKVICLCGPKGFAGDP